MANQTEGKSGVVAFFGTLPGIITAVATLITALVAAGLIGNAIGESDGDQPPNGGGDIPVTVEVPDVVGWFINDATAELEGRDLFWVVQEIATGEVEPGHVQSQDPPGGSIVEPGTEIVLWEEASPLEETADTL